MGWLEANESEAMEWTVVLGLSTSKDVHRLSRSGRDVVSEVFVAWFVLSVVIPDGFGTQRADVLIVGFDDELVRYGRRATVLESGS